MPFCGARRSGQVLEYYVYLLVLLASSTTTVASTHIGALSYSVLASTDLLVLLVRLYLQVLLVVVLASTYLVVAPHHTTLSSTSTQSTAVSLYQNSVVHF